MLDEINLRDDNGRSSEMGVNGEGQPTHMQMVFAFHILAIPGSLYAELQRHDLRWNTADEV